MGQNRLLYGNRIWDAETILDPSSEVATLPAMHLKDQLRQKPWRTKTGWTIIDEFNNRLPFFAGGIERVAFIQPGHYVSGTDLAAVIQAAMETAYSLPVWAVDYGVAAPNKFRIHNPGTPGAPINFDLQWFTSDADIYSIGRDLGFQVTSDDTGGTSYTADFTAYQSRHYLKIQRTDGDQIVATAAVLLDHNFGPPSGVGSYQAIKIQSNDVDTPAGWESPSSSTTISGLATDNPRLSLLVVGFDDFWRLLIEDVGNPAGYVELGTFYLGETVAPAINVSTDLANAPEDFSTIEVGIDGTHFRDAHRRRDRWSLAYLQMDSATRAMLDALEAENPVGKNFFFVWDVSFPNGHGNGILGTTYGYLAAPFSQQYVPGTYWTYAAPFNEAL